MRNALSESLLVLLALSLLACSSGAGRGAEVGEIEVGHDRSDPPHRPLSDSVARGVNYASVHRGGGYGSEESRAELDTLRAMGVNWIALSPFAFQPGAEADALASYDSASDTYAPRRGPMADSGITREVAAAHSRGVKVLLKPHLWSHDFGGGGEWHGTVRQRSSAAHALWWRSYRAYILYYARLAEASGCDAFCLGVELERQTLEHPDEWRGLARDVRKVYRGALTYAAHWEREYWKIGFWDALDIVGLNAYFPLPLGDSASAEEIAEGLGRWFDSAAAVARSAGRQLWLTEVGYRAERGTLREPWRENSGPYDPELQARGYEGLMRAVERRNDMRGVFLWKTFTSPSGARAVGEDSAFVFRGRPAEAVLRRWYSRR